MINVICHIWGEQDPYPLQRQYDLIFADGPYNLGMSYADDPTKDCRANWEYWVHTTIAELSGLLRMGGTIWWLCSASDLNLAKRELYQCGFMKYMIIKEETFTQYNRFDLTLDYRILFCFQKLGGNITFNPDEIRIPSARQEVNDERADPRGRIPGQVWKFRRLQGTSAERQNHPCQLPEELLERIVLGWSNPNDRILDAFAGSGNMGRVCSRLNRNCDLVDQSPTYCEQMKIRMANLHQENLNELARLK